MSVWISNISVILPVPASNHTHRKKKILTFKQIFLNLVFAHCLLPYQWALTGSSSIFFTHSVKYLWMLKIPSWALSSPGWIFPHSTDTSHMLSALKPLMIFMAPHWTDSSIFMSLYIGDPRTGYPSVYGLVSFHIKLFPS